MPTVCGDAAIKIIQGDSYGQSIFINGIPDDYIDKIYFTCATLGVQKELDYNSESKRYKLAFTAEETAEFKLGATNYDLTIYFNTDEVKTIIYKNTINILPKVNKVNINEL